MLSININHNMDPNSNINNCRKIPPTIGSVWQFSVLPTCPKPTQISNSVP
jgi:hypothetical protein